MLTTCRMPMLDGFQATKRIREIEQEVPTPAGDELRLSLALNGRIPIFAVSASLHERQREEMIDFGLDGWILKPIDYKRMNVILRGILDVTQRNSDLYAPGCSWEAGGWLAQPPTPLSEAGGSASARGSQSGSSRAGDGSSSRGGRAPAGVPEPEPEPEAYFDERSSAPS